MRKLICDICEVETNVSVPVHVEDGFDNSTNKRIVKRIDVCPHCLQVCRRLELYCDIPLYDLKMEMLGQEIMSKRQRNDNGEILIQER